MAIKEQRTLLVWMKEYKTLLKGSQVCKPRKFFKTIKILSNKCNSNLHFKGEKTSLRGKDSSIIKLTIQWIFKTCP